MSLIEWDDRFSVGVASVDHEHRQLIALINATHARLRRSGAEDDVLDFLGEIYTRISAHFALEERLMQEKHYDQYSGHKTDHERLLDQIRDMMDDYEDKNSFNEAQFSDKLQAWFTGHFRTHDARLHRTLG